MWTSTCRTSASCDQSRSRSGARVGQERRFGWWSQTTAAPPERVSDSLTNEGGAVMPKGYGLSEATKEGIWELRAEGLSDREIGRRLGLPRGTVSHYLARAGGIRPRAAAAPRALPEPRRARGDLARDRPRALGPRHRPGASAAPTRRSPVRSTAAAAGGATAPTRQSARPGGGRGGRGRRSSSSRPELRRLVSERLERTTPPSRSRAGSGSNTPTMRRCGSPTRRSTAPSTSRRGGRLSASSPGT